MRVVWAVDHGLQSCSKEMEARLGITGPQRLVIRIVGRSPGIAAGELAETLKLHPSTLTGILRRLEQRQILVRSPDPRDARRALFRLTEEGRRLDQVRTGTVESAVRRAMRRLRPEEVSTARAVLMTLAEEMSADAE